MKKIITALLLLTTVTAIAQKKSGKGKWIKLFNGKDLKGWTVKIKDHPVNDNWGKAMISTTISLRKR